MTNITGEKIYENQVIETMRSMEKAFELDIRFYQMLANEKEARYELYIEPISEGKIDISTLTPFLDKALQSENIEYQSKRSSGRLRPLEIFPLKQGAFEMYKSFFLAQGQREGQFKPQILQYKKDLIFNITEYCIR